MHTEAKKEEAHHRDGAPHTRRHGKTAKTFATHPIGGAILAGIAVILILAGLVAWVRSWFSDDEGGNTTQASEQAPAQPRIPGPCEGPWTIKSFEIPPEGLKVYLCQGWQDYPQGGKITIRTPGGVELEDEPGVLNNFGFQPEGVYTVLAKPIGEKRTVRIYNRW